MRGLFRSKCGCVTFDELLPGMAVISAASPCSLFPKYLVAPPHRHLLYTACHGVFFKDKLWHQENPASQDPRRVDGEFTCSEYTVNETLTNTNKINRLRNGLPSTKRNELQTPHRYTSQVIYSQAHVFVIGEEPATTIT